MAYRLQFRKDTLDNWNKYNPQLADGEVGYIRGTNLYKIGDPWTQEEIDLLPEENRPAVGSMKFWNELPTFGFNGNFSDTLDNSDGSNPDNTALNKTVLVNKFNSIEEEISKLSTKEELLSLSERIDNIDEEISRINDTIVTVNSSLDTINDTIITVNTNVEKKADKSTTLAGYGIEDAYTKEEINSLEERINDKHQVLTKSEYDQKVNNGEIEEGVFYYTYEETE